MAFHCILNRMLSSLWPNEALPDYLLTPSLTLSAAALPLAHPTPVCQALELARFVPASGSWHLLLLLPGMLCPRSSHGKFFSPFRSQVESHPLREYFSGQLPFPCPWMWHTCRHIILLYYCICTHITFVIILFIVYVFLFIVYVF